MPTIANLLSESFPAIILGVALAGMIFMSPSNANADDTKHSKVLLKTSKGDITLELYDDKAPETVKNFLTYVGEGFYNGTIFHRVINGFMIQGGGMDADMVDKPTHDPVQNEADNGVKNEAYTIAMARTMDPDSATAQFFINVKDNEFLNHRAKTIQGWGYCAFGKVVAGQDVVDAIKEVPTTNKGMYEDVPADPVVIESATIVE